nr:CAP domain-containing protein [Anoxybacillus tepidamans]
MDEGRNDNNKNRKNDNISSLSTTIPSSQYPNTRAILIQDSKYEFIPVDPRQAAQWQARFQQPWAQQQMPYTSIPNNTQQRSNQPSPQTPAQRPQTQAPAAAGISQYARQVIDLTNRERARAGLPALQIDTKLSAVAQRKSEDMQQNHYFSHTSPTYGSPFDMMRDFGITYRTAGENIAQGQRTPQEVVTAWMNSPGHRANILNRQFTHIGVGFEQAGNHWTQMFIGK